MTAVLQAAGCGGLRECSAERRAVRPEPVVRRGFLRLVGRGRRAMVNIRCDLLLRGGWSSQPESGSAEV